MATILTIKDKTIKDAPLENEISALSIAQQIKSNPQLKKLRLINNQLKPESLRIILIAVLGNTNIQELEISNNFDLGAEGASLLTQFFSTNRTINKIRLVDINLGQDENVLKKLLFLLGVREEELSNQKNNDGKLKVVDFSSNNLRAEHLPMLCGFIKKCTLLEELFLDSNPIGCQNTKPGDWSFYKMPSVQLASLFGVYPTAMVPSNFKNTRLRKLGLSNINLGDELYKTTSCFGKKKVKSALKLLGKALLLAGKGNENNSSDKNSLEHVDLSGNNFGPKKEEGAQALMNGMNTKFCSLFGAKPSYAVKLTSLSIQSSVISEQYERNFLDLLDLTPRENIKEIMHPKEDFSGCELSDLKTRSDILHPSVATLNTLKDVPVEPLILSTNLSTKTKPAGSVVQTIDLTQPKVVLSTS